MPTTLKPLEDIDTSTQVDPPDHVNEPMFRDDRIRLAAYRRFLERGDGGGDETTDWLEAEAEIDSEDAVDLDDSIGDEAEREA